MYFHAAMFNLLTPYNKTMVLTGQFPHLHGDNDEMVSLGESHLTIKPWFYHASLTSMGRVTGWSSSGELGKRTRMVKLL